MDPVSVILDLGRRARTRVDPGARLLFAASAGAALVVAGHLARHGTTAPRVAAAALVASVGLAYGARWLLWRRDFKRRERLVRRLLAGADPALGERVLRAMALEEHVRRDPGAGSAELASLHVSRLVRRIPQKLVERHSDRRGRLYRVVGTALLFAAVTAVALAPFRVAEGLDVLLARRGIAPLDLVWLESLSVVSQPPPYLREPDRYVDPSAGQWEPQGSTLVVRGELKRAGRHLVLTDGTKEVAFSEDGNRGVVARWTLDRDVTLHIAARFGDVLIRDPSPVGVRSSPDLPPAVVLDGAPRTVALEGLEGLELRYGVTDDHGLRQIDLVLRSGGQEERRVLEKLDGQARVTHGAQALDQKDPFLRRMFLPVTVSIEAKDTNVLGSAEWGKSKPITITPPAVGDQEAARYVAMREARGGVLDVLAWLLTSDAGTADHRRELGRRRDAAAERLREAARGVYKGLRVTPGLATFLLGQAERLEQPRAGVTPRAALEDVVLAVDAAVRSLGNRDAQTVAKRLGDVAEEVADGFEEARETERRARGRERARTALEVLKTGTKNLALLDELGADLGSVAEGEMRRIARADAAESLLHAELAARHLAARLRRPTPSFGSAGGGVESGGHGTSTEPAESPSEADREFDQVAEELDQLVREHAALIEQVERDLEEAERAAGTEDLKREAAERAARLRQAVDRLPRSGAPEGSGRAAAALGREHARSMADRLERLEFGEAVESGRTARSLVDEAARKAESPTSAADLADPESLGEAGRVIAEQLAWAEQAEQRKRSDAAERGRSRMKEAATRERSIERRLGELERRGERGDSRLPEEARERLERARGAMRQAASELEAGQGEPGLEQQREAQRLLEQSSSGSTSSEDGSSRGESREGSDNGRSMDQRAEVPGVDDKRRAEEFRRRVLEGLGKQRGGRLSPAVQRYAEGLLQ